MDSSKKLALVLSGGGARGAYEAGVLHYISSQKLLKSDFGKNFDVITGSSVGAINACFMAATAHNLKYQSSKIYDIWKNLKQENVYKRDVATLAQMFGRSVSGVFKNLFRRVDNTKHAHDPSKHFRGLFNTTPLKKFITNVIPWKQITLNLNQNLFDALCITSTQVASGLPELFIEKRPNFSYTGHYIWHDIKIDYKHALASAAIPIVFPTVKIGSQDYMDGGLRLNTPMSPAIQLHADKILAIGPQDPSQGATERSENGQKVDFLKRTPAPSLGSVFGKLLNSIFLDKLDYDIEQMERINRIIQWGEECYGKDFLDKINAHIRDNNITGDIANRGLKRLEVLEIYPSEDIRKIFVSSVQKSDFFKNDLTSFEKILLKLLDVDLSTGQDFLSYIMFYPEYISKLIELGYEDAKSQHDTIHEFLTQSF